MSIKEKESILKDLTKMQDADKAFVQGWCAHAVAAAGSERTEAKEEEK